jgi:hypothetical protein
MIAKGTGETLTNGRDENDSLDAGGSKASC